MTLEQLTELGWELTDPNSIQICKKISETVYLYKQYKPVYFINDKGKMEVSNGDLEYITIDQFNNSKLWDEEEVDIDDYTEEELKDYISPYYSSLEEIIEIYGKEGYNQIVIECIFEQSISLE